MQYAVPRGGLPSAASFRSWTRFFSSPVVLRIVGLKESRELNFAYRKRDKPTNVLSFPYGDDGGDIVLCHPVIAREARAQGKTLAAHYAHLVVHGVLHLQGYDHEKKRHARRMERREISLLRRLGFRNPYELE